MAEEKTAGYRPTSPYINSSTSSPAAKSFVKPEEGEDPKAAVNDDVIF
jgi:hypothetical protein